MKLNDNKIKEYVKKGKIKILPNFDEKQLRPVGLRIHLDNKIIVYNKGQKIDLSKNVSPKYKIIDISKKSYTLKPQEFILASTKERITTEPNILCELDGRSTLARLGIGIHVTAKIADGTFFEEHAIVLEIFNHSNITYLIKEGLPIGCVTFEILKGKINIKRFSKSYMYKGQNSLMPANMK